MIARNASRDTEDGHSLTSACIYFLLGGAFPPRFALLPELELLLLLLLELESLSDPMTKC